jgi:8-oxo-dGTP diphosphatase
MEIPLPQAPSFLDVSDLVRAAGGLILRPVDGARMLALVHRPRYDDWTFPKGKLHPGETDEQTALREVAEETGLRCTLVRDLGTVRYRDGDDRPKVVRYWVMEAKGEEAFVPNAEVDELRWLSEADASQLLSYEHDRALLKRFSRGEGDATAYLVRHARAGSRDKWHEDDALRPLSKAGRRQAEALVATFRGIEVARIVSSPSVRCVQTVRPLALDRGLPVETSDALAEGAALEDAMDLLAGLASTPAVLCSHGDVIPAVVMHLVDREATISGERDWKKGSVWVLEREDGRVARARYLPPPEVG